MDDKKFDDVSRVLGSNKSRRGLLKVIAGALGFAAAGQASDVVGKPKCRGEGHPCEGNQECCDGLVCVKGGGNGNAARCVKKHGTTTKKYTTTTRKYTTTPKPTTTTTTTTTRKYTTTPRPTTTRKYTTTTRKY